METDKLVEAIEIAKTLAIARPAWKIEICGSWVWIDGTEKSDTDGRELLKSLKCVWSRDKGKWYHKGESVFFHRNGNGGMDMQYIRTKYGSQHVRVQEDQAA